MPAPTSSRSTRPVAVAGVDANAIDFHGSRRGDEIGLARCGQRILRTLARFERCSDHTRIGTDRQRVAIAIVTARQRHELAGAIALGKGSRAPARLLAIAGRNDPDLEDLGDRILHIIFAVRDAGAGAHHLYVARFGAALVAEVILVGDRTLSDIGDDFHVAMGVGRESGLRRDRIVVPDAQIAPAFALGIIVIREAEMMLGVEPAMVGTAQRREGTKVDHDTSPDEGRRIAGGPR